MGNEQIVEQSSNGGKEFVNMYDMMDLARQDEREKWKPYLLDSVLTDAEFKEYTGSEREKMQGVEVWVSWDEDKHTMLSLSVPVLSIDKPEYNNHSIVGKNYRYNDNDDYSAGLTREIAKHLNIQQGQCKKFRIVEVGNE